MMRQAAHPVSEASDEVRQVCEWLLRPSVETMEACVPALDRAVAHIRQWCAGEDLPNADPQLIQALTALATEIRSAQALLSSAGNLYWGRLRPPITPPPDGGSNPEPISVTG